MQKLNQSAIAFATSVFLLFAYLILADQALADSKETVTYDRFTLVGTKERSVP